MSNKYLEKIAKETIAEPRKRGSNYASAAEGLVGATVMHESAPSLLGYHKLYHGTSNSVADKIRTHGFDPSAGGSGASRIQDQYVKESSGKIHFTKAPHVARYFAGTAQVIEDDVTAGIKPKATNEMLNRTLKGAYINMKGTVLHTRVPDSFYRRMDADPDMGGNKYGASRTTEKIPHEHVSKSFFSDAKRFASKDHMADYLKHDSARFKRGLAGSVLGAALLAHGAHSALTKRNG